MSVVEVFLVHAIVDVVDVMLGFPSCRGYKTSLRGGGGSGEKRRERAWKVEKTYYIVEPETFL